MVEQSPTTFSCSFRPTSSASRCNVQRLQRRQPSVLPTSQVWRSAFGEAQTNSPGSGSSTVPLNHRYARTSENTFTQAGDVPLNAPCTGHRVRVAGKRLLEVL